MATMKPENLQPVCQMPGCKEGAQMLSIKGTTATWMKTCKRHTYKDLPNDLEEQDTFWPPETDK
jgi:hypothetical protein